MAAPTSLPKPFITLDDPHAGLEIIGGKGANLVKLAIAGFHVPNGFLIPTSVYQSFVRSHRLDVVISDVLERSDSSDPQALESASSEIRAAFSSGAFPPDLASSLDLALRWLGSHPVAVRSSATAEDLPDLSFAGQQDTYLNVIGPSDASRAVVDCWSSLWTARAIGYRSRNGIAHGDVSLSVVVQLMVPAEASGVLFTANPLTGRRGEVVVDATLGLGEALVGGLVEPDHYVVDAEKGGITHKNLGSKAVQIRGKSGGGVSTKEDAESGQVQAVPDDVILQLSRIGKEIEALYDFPQDVEFAVMGGKVHILQSRPITSLYPLPLNLPPEPLKVMFGLHQVQGMFEPYTPLGHTTIREILVGGGRLFGIKRALKEQTVFNESGGRVWIDVAPVLRHAVGRRVWLKAVQGIDRTIPQNLSEVLCDPRLAPRKTRGVPWRVALFFLARVPRLVRSMLFPERMAKRTLALFDEHVAKAAAGLKSTGNMALDFRHNVALLTGVRTLFADFVVPMGIPSVAAGMFSFIGVLMRFSEQLAEETGEPRFKTLFLEIAKGIPNNVTTEMDLILWETALALKADRESSELFGALPASELAARYVGGTLPSVAQDAVSAFLARYGMRGLGEIDIGRPRWSEEPEHIAGVLQSYLQIDDPDLAPAAVFARGAEEARRAAEELEAAVRRNLRFGRLKARLVRFAVRRYRALGGLREAPKFFAIRMMGLIRTGLLTSGEQMVGAGWLSQRDDLFYLEMSELEEFAQEIDGWEAGDAAPAVARLPSLRALIQDRREMRARELRRKQIPRLMLSDGTAFYEGVRAPENAADAIVGDPVSPGVVEGVVRVVFDPLGTRLKPGEILVCPGTDPAWTPLFLAAHGLVTEVGGMMTHGSVVAREYGIPAVVGVHEVTKRLQTGQRIRLDGSSGLIETLSTEKD